MLVINKRSSFMRRSRIFFIMGTGQSRAPEQGTCGVKPGFLDWEWYRVCGGASKNPRRRKCVFRWSVRPVVRYPLVYCPLTPILREAISLYYSGGSSMQLGMNIITWVGIAKNFTRPEVKGQGHGSWPGQLTYNGGGRHVDGVASNLTCFYLI